MPFDKNSNTNMHNYSHQIDLFKIRRNHKKEKTKSQESMENIAKWIAFYRANPHRFVLDFMGINLRPFQCVLLWAMINNQYFMFLGSRGLGFEILT